MFYARARVRYLAALGLPALAVSTFGCSSGGTGATSNSPVPTATSSAGPTGEPSATPTADPVTSATASPSATASDTPVAVPTSTASVQPAASSWVPVSDPRHSPSPSPSPSRPVPPVPSCPHGLFCIEALASSPASPAPAPFAACAADASVPHGSLGPVGRPPSRPAAFEPATTKQERKTHVNACCYEWHILCSGGRPLASSLAAAGAMIVAGTLDREDWLSVIGEIDATAVSPAERAAVAAHYLREATFEHASVAAFARASLALLALGAPADLVAGAHAAAMDEIEHARLTFALATALGGETRGPARLDLSMAAALPSTLAELAVETFNDACAGESIAALSLREASAETHHPVIAEVLGRIASDEERHAELAWRTVAWALRNGGDPVRQALAMTVESLRTASETSLKGHGDRCAANAEETFHASRHGVLTAAAQRAIRARALHEVVLPCAEALLAAGAIQSDDRGPIVHQRSDAVAVFVS